MGPSTTSRNRKYFKISNGIMISGKEPNEVTFDTFEGYLKGINYSEKEVDFKKDGKLTNVKQWEVIFSLDNNEEWVWSTRYTGIDFQNFLNSVLSIETFGVIKIKTYIKDGRGKLLTFNNNASLKWKYQPSELPKVEQIMVKGKPYLDASGNPIYDFDARMEWTTAQVNNLNAILGYDPNAFKQTQEVAEVTVEDEQPY